MGVALYRGIRKTRHEYPLVFRPWDVISVRVLPLWACLLAKWWSGGEAVPYVGSGAGFAGTG